MSRPATPGPSRRRSPAAVALPATRGRAASNGAATSASGASAASGTVAGVTTTTANAMLVGCIGGELLLGDAHVAGRAEPGLGAWGDRRFELADGRQATAGGSGAKTWTFSASREWAGWLVALRPQP